MVAFRGSSRRDSASSSSSCDDIKILIFKCLRSRVVYATDGISKSRRSMSYPAGQLKRFSHPESKWTPVKKTQVPHLAITIALNYYNQNSVPKYELLRPGSVTPVTMPKGSLYHVDFTAKNTDVTDAPEERFFAELKCPAATKLLSARLCVSLGPIKTIAGNRCCNYCCPYNNVWHPKGGGFTRGHDKMYKTLQDIFDIAVVHQEKHLPMLKEVSQDREPKKESEYSLQHVNNASLYATQVVKFISQRDLKNYELVNRAFGTHVILPKCSIFHINFKAKEADPMAPKKLFFAELTIIDGVVSFKRCRDLSPTELKSGNVTGDKTNGCYYCHKFNKVRHPLTGGFVRGGDSLYISDKEFYY